MTNISTSQKNEILLKLGYDCEGMLKFAGSKRFQELAMENPRLAEIGYYPPSKQSLDQFIDESYDLVIKHTKDKPLIVNSNDLPSSLEAHIPTKKPRRAPIRPSRDFRL